MGRVSRTPSTQVSSPTRKRRDHPYLGRKGAERRSNPLLRWIYISLALAFIGLGVFAGLWFNQEHLSVATLAPPAATVKTYGRSQFTPPAREEAIAFVKRGLIVRESNEIAHYFLPCKSSPQMISAFLANLEHTDGTFANFESLGTLNTRQLQIEGVAVTFNSSEGTQKRLALLSPTIDGQWKIDFDGFARTAQPSWEEFLGNQVDEAEVRVTIAEGTYYQGAFRDNKEWLSYRMESPDRPELMQGYCKIGSPQSLVLQRLFGTGAKEVRMTLKLRRVEFTQPHQFEISRVYSGEWIRPIIPSDEVL